MTIKELKIIIISFLLFILLCGVSSAQECISSRPELNCQAAVLMDNNTGTVLYEKNSDELLSPASMTKLMTMYLVIEKVKDGSINLDDTYIVSKNADFRNAPPHSSLMFLEKGQKVTVRDILSGLAVSSGNDCAVAAAEIVSGSYEEFLALMNRKSREMGFNSFIFYDAAGFNSENKVNPMEFCQFCRIFIKDCKEFFPFTVSQEEFTYPQIRNLNGTKAAYGGITQHNNNELLGKIQGIYGLKTGHLDEVGYNVALAGKMNGMDLVAVIMGIKAENLMTGRIMRVADGTALMMYGFYSFRTFVPEISEKLEVYVKGARDRALVNLPEDVNPITVSYYDIEKLKFDIELDTKVSAPVTSGSRAGKCTLMLGDRALETWELTFAGDVPAASFIQRIKRFFSWKKEKNLNYNFSLDYRP